jgi:hypothetical protein
MKALRFIAYGLLLMVAAFATAVVAVVRNQDKIAEIALAIIHQRTGFEVRITGTRMGFGTHFVMVLEHPRVLAGGVEVATVDDIRAVLSLRAILHSSGLPLARLVLDHPRVKIPMSGESVTIGGIPRLDARGTSTLKLALDALSGTTNQVDVLGAVLTDEDNASIVQRLDLRAYKRHKRRAGNWPWIVAFATQLNHGLRATGHLSLGPQANQLDPIGTGRLWFWGLDLQRIDLRGLKASTQLGGNLTLAYDDAGAVSGRAEITASDLVLQPDTATANEQLGNYTASTLFKASPDSLELGALDVRQGSTTQLVGKLTMGRPFDDDRTLSFDVGGTTLDLARIAQLLRPIGSLPPRLTKLTDPLNSGKLTLTRAALDTRTPLRDWTVTTLRHNLQLSGAISSLGYQFPSASQLPPLTNLKAQLDYSSGVLKVSPGSSDIGHSHIKDFSVEANLQDAPGHIPYKIQLKADLDLTELFPAANSAVRAVSPAVADRCLKLEGRAPVTVAAAGDVSNSTSQTPRSYLATVELAQLGVKIKGAPVQITLSDGEVSMAPGLITLRQVRLVPAGGNRGSVTIDGAVELGPTTPLAHGLTARVDGLAVEDWLPLLVSPDSLAADGPVTGSLTANSDRRKGGLPVVTGKLNLGTGHLQLGFLRSPIATQSATVTLDGKGFALNVPDSRLEGAPFDLSLIVQDFAHPRLRIDALAAKLDFEVMRFIRFPWSPHKVPHFFAAAAYGHIEARQANFGKLPMSEVATDFSRDSATWHIDNFTARVLGGSLRLQIAGQSGPNNWIHMVSRIVDMDASQPFLLSGEKKPPLTGRLFTNADLWADTGPDFFDTLAGTLSLDVHDGKLDRLTLLNRILSLIDLKSWLTAHFPDPLVAGLPFTILTAHLKGTAGDFYTDDLRLEGPAMDITAMGDVRLGNQQVDMRVGLFPFHTANWIVHQIPIVGTNLGNGSSGLVAAYFHVYGPFNDPTVRPKPITSVTEFVKKMLGLPINIIVPNTIK